MEAEGRLAVRIVFTDGAGDEQYAVQLGHVFRTSHGGGGHQGGTIRRAGSQIDGDAGAQLVVQFQLAGVDHHTIGRDQLDLTGGGSNARLQVIGEGFRAQIVLAETGKDAGISRALCGHQIGVALGCIGFHIDGFRRQPVIFLHRDAGRVLRRGHACRQDKGQTHQGSTGHQLQAQGSCFGAMAVTHTVFPCGSDHFRLNKRVSVRITRLRYRSAR